MDNLQENRIVTIEREIKQLKQKTASCIIEIGERLIEAKELLDHGLWEKWLDENVEISQRTARNFMRIAKTFSVEERQAIAEMEITRLYYLAEIPEDERPFFLDFIRQIEEKSPVSTRKFRYWVKMWTNRDFEAAEISRITDHIIEKGSTDMLIAWEEILTKFIRFYSELSIRSKMKVEELISTGG